MEWLKRYWPALVLIAALVAVLDVTASSLWTCHPPPENAASSIKDQYDKDCSYLHGPVLISLEWLIAFIDDHDGFFVVMFTAVLAAFTAALWRSTNNLWDAGERQLITTRSVAAVQARNTRRQLKTTEEISRSQLRAFVFGKFVAAPNAGQHGIIYEYVFFAHFENVGLTPATEVKTWMKIQTFPKIDNSEPHFAADTFVPPTVMGPRADVFSALRNVPLQTMIDCWRNEVEIYVWSRIEYRDIFNPTIIHHHEQCGSVILLNHPDQPPAQGSPGNVGIGFYGPQNSTS